MMKQIIPYFLVFLIFGFVNSKVVQGPGSEQIPSQPNFTSVECFYCGHASQYIAGLSPAFPTFYPNVDNFKNYLDTVSSLVCDVYGDGDSKHCDITTRYIALTVYSNYLGDSTSDLEMTKTLIEWANNFFTPLCEAIEELELVCLSLDAIGLSLDICKEGFASSAICPATLNSCEICSHYFGCAKNIYC